jgi:UPF0716 protein FxsA
VIRILLPALFLLFPLAEIACFILVGRRIGLFPTLSLVILSGVAGVLLMRLQGLGTLAKLRESARRGESPGRQVLDTAMIVVAGLLLLIPGFLSDIIGILLFLPPVRTWLWNRLIRNIVVVDVGTGRPRREPPGSPKTIDLDEGEFRSDRERDPRSPGDGL